MLYQLLFFCILSFFQVSSITQLSRTNCPSRFYIKQSNVTNITKQQLKAHAKTFFSLYDSDNLKSSIQQMVIKGNQKQLATYAMKSLTPYLIVVILFFLLFITMCICSTFSRSCPPNSLRRDLKTNPYTIYHFRIITIITSILAIGVIVAGLISLSYIPSLKRNISLTTCSVYVTLDSVLNGQDNTGWGGFNNLYSKIGNVTRYLAESLPNFGSYLSGDEWLIDQMQNLKKMNINIYNHNKDSKLLSPNPNEIKRASDNGLPVPTIQSLFISKGLGPNGTSNTMITDIDKGLRTTQILSKQAYQIQLSSKRVIDSNSTLLSNANASRRSMQMYISQLNKTASQIDTFKKDYLKVYFKMFLDALQGIIGVLIIGGMASVIGICAVYLFQIFTCKSLVTFSWAIYGVGFIGSMGLLFVTLGMGSLGYGFCNYFDVMINNKSDFVKLGASNSQNPFTRLDSCFYGDGNVLSKFNLATQMGTVTQVFKNINQYYDYEDELSTKFVDKTISTGKLSNWMSVILRYQKGIFIDYNQSITTDDNPNYSIKNLALYTKNGTGFPICAKDHWVFDSTNCTSNQTLYITGDADNGKALQMTNSSIKSICISFNQKFSTLMNAPWTQSDFTQRYTQTRKDCADAYDKILFYGYALINFRDTRINLFKGIYDSLDQIYTKNLIFNNNLTIFKNKLAIFQNSVTDLNNAVTNSLNGLLVSSDCRAIVNNVRFVYNMFCINAMYDFIRIGWCCIFLCIFSFLGMIAGYFFSSWFGEVEKNTKMFEEDYNPQIDFLEVSSQTIMKDKQVKIEKKTEQNNIGKDLQKLGQFTTYIGVKKQDKKEDKKQKKKVLNYNSDDSSQQQNPYAMEFNQ